MTLLFPWETPEIVEDHFSGPCLFMAFYRLYKNAYFGQSFQLSGTFIQDKILKERIENLPLDIKRIIFTKIWEKIEPSRAFIVQRGDLLLDFSLHYLLVQYSKLKSRTKDKVPQGYACWTGYKVSKSIYKFVYGPMNLSITPFIPDFMCQNKISPLAQSFSLVCPNTFAYIKF
jgi:hypothetical protein